MRGNFGAWPKKEAEKEKRWGNLKSTTSNSSCDALRGLLFTDAYTVYLNFRVGNAPLQDSESVPAFSAAEGINVKKTQKPFKTNPFDPSN
jgi:hypothetical protein